LGLILLVGLAEAQLTGTDPRTGQAPQPVLKQVEKPIPEGTCGSYGTSVEFVSSPSEAARKAKQEEKLVFVLHVSGLFEDPNLT
jgi:hypothetical protein